MRKLLPLILLLSFYHTIHAQDGTIHVQRNPVRRDSIWCGGVLQRSFLLVEFNYYEPVKHPWEIFYAPTSFPNNGLDMRNGSGLHILLSANRMNFFYGAVGWAKFFFVTGVDAFGGSNNVFDHISDPGYRFYAVPVLLRTYVKLVGRQYWMFGLEGDAGIDIFQKQVSEQTQKYLYYNTKGSFKAGMVLHRLIGRGRIIGVSFNAAYRYGQWFREASLTMPLYYGKYHK